MNILRRISLQSLKKNRTRTAVTVVGVALSAALVTAAVTFGLSLLDYAAAGAAQKYGGWHAAFLDVDADFARQRAADPEAASVFAMESQGYAALPGGQNPDKPYVYPAGFSKETLAGLPLTLLSGRMPENDGEALIPSHVAANGGVSLAEGDTLSLAVGRRMLEKKALGQADPYTPGEALVATEEKTYTVVGAYARLRFEGRTAPGYTVITKADGRAAAQNLFVALRNPRQVKAYAQSAARGHACVLNNEVLRFMGLSTDGTDNLFNVLLYSIAGIVIAIIMVGSIFLIYNSFSISLNERVRELGLLASVGATARQLRNAVLFEGLCIGAAGIPLGVLCGLGGVGIVISVVAKNFSSIMYSGVPLTLRVSLPALLASAAISLATILLSAYLPAKKAVARPVMDCIRQTDEIKAEARALQTPRWADRLYGLEGALALKNFKRNKKRYRSIVLSLALSVVLFLSTGAFVTELNQTAAQSAAYTDYDVGFCANDMDDGELLALYHTLKTAKGVTESACQEVVNYICAAPTSALSPDYWAATGAEPAGETTELPIELQFLDDEAYARLLAKAGLSDGEGTLLAVTKLQAGSGGRAGEKEAGDFRELFKTPAVEAALLPVTDGAPCRELAKSVTIACVQAVPPDIPPTAETSAYTKQQNYYFLAFAPWSGRDAFLSAAAPDVRAKGMTFSSDTPAATTAEMEKMLRQTGVRTAYTLLNFSRLLEENRNYVFIANVFSYTFIVMISLIAAANVFNTVSTNIRLRRRELAMLRSVGMADRAFNRMMRWECAFYGARALGVGLPLGALACWLVHWGMRGGGADTGSFSLPWADAGVSVLCVLLVIFATMGYAVGKLKKENILDALRDDMT